MHHSLATSGHFPRQPRTDGLQSQCPERSNPGNYRSVHNLRLSHEPVVSHHHLDREERTLMGNEVLEMCLHAPHVRRIILTNVKYARRTSRLATEQSVLLSRLRA